MRRTRTLAKEKLQELQDQHRELEEHMLAVFAEVIDHTIQTPEDNAAFGQGVRDILKNDGGAEALRARYEQVSAYHNDNYRPLMWRYLSALSGSDLPTQPALNVPFGHPRCVAHRRLSLYPELRTHPA